jgi:hypothetical protein
MALPFIMVVFFLSICVTLTEKYVCRFDRRLHSDLANLTENLRRANSDLESSRREVENLKHQLQEYVSEVRRVEELLAKKVGIISGAPFTILCSELSLLEEIKWVCAITVLCLCVSLLSTSKPDYQLLQILV